MKTKIIFILIIIAFKSCMSSIKKHNTYNINPKLHENLKKKIIGVWGSNPDENADMEINKDSIFYVDQPYKQYFYELKHDSLFVYIDSFISKSKIIMPDSNHLWLIGYGDTTRLIRIK